MRSEGHPNQRGHLVVRRGRPPRDHDVAGAPAATAARPVIGRHGRGRTGRLAGMTVAPNQFF